MKLLYIDESGSTGLDLLNKQQPIFTLCGIIIDEKNWVDINNKISYFKYKVFDTLEDFEIHTTEIFNGKDNKKINFRKNTVEKNLNCLSTLIDLTLDLDLKIIVAKIDKPDYHNKAMNDTKGIYKCKCHGYIMQPYVRCLTCISAWYEKYLKENGTTGMVFIDEQKPLEFWIKHNFKFLQTKLKDNRIIEKPFITDSVDNEFIQITDLFNFYINKYYCITEYNLITNEYKRKHCLEQFEKIKNKIIFIDVK